MQRARGSNALGIFARVLEFRRRATTENIVSDKAVGGAREQSLYASAVCECVCVVNCATKIDIYMYTDRQTAAAGGHTSLPCKPFGSGAVESN